MSYKASYDYVKLKQITSSKSYPSDPHYVVMIFDSNDDVTVWTTPDKEELKANVIALNSKGCDFVFFHVEKIGKHFVKTTVTIEL